MKALKTHATTMIRRAFAKALLLEKYPDRFPYPDDITAFGVDRSRRDFLRTAVRASAGLALGSALGACGVDRRLLNGSGGVEIAIVGGGVAGLFAAYLLRREGYGSTVYEASKRTGGRMFSAGNLMGPGLTSELGGEYIDSNHRDILGIAQSFGLELIDTHTPENKALHGESFFFNDRFYSEEDVVAAFRPIAGRIAADAAAVSPDIGYAAATPGDRALDQTSIAAYLGKMDLDPWFYKLLDAAYTSELGLEIAEQSALNFITLIGTEADAFRIFGASDERYKIRGGNQQIPDLLAEQVKDQIRTEHALEAISEKGRRYVLRFSNGVEKTADVLILCLPFTKLREVDLRVALPPVKKKAILELSYGTNSKLLLGMNTRPWREQGYVGYLFNETVQNGWDNSLEQNNNQGNGGFTVFLGGRAGKTLNINETERYMSAADEAFKGLRTAHNGKKEVFNWANYRYTQGSYAAYSVGQWTSISGAEAEPAGNIFFAGEHCSGRFQGFMNGAAATGREAARAVLQKIKTGA